MKSVHVRVYVCVCVCLLKNTHNVDAIRFEVEGGKIEFSSYDTRILI